MFRSGRCELLFHLEAKGARGAGLDLEALRFNGILRLLLLHHPRERALTYEALLAHFMSEDAGVTAPGGASYSSTRASGRRSSSSSHSSWLLLLDVPGPSSAARSCSETWTAVAEAARTTAATAATAAMAAMVAAGLGMARPSCTSG